MSNEHPAINENLKELRSSGYEMVKGEPDIRGWQVVDSRNVTIGKIKDLLFDVASKKVRYLIFDLDGKPINLMSRCIIVPVGLAELDATENVVYFPDITVGHLASLPEYKANKVSYQVEKQIRDVFLPENSVAGDKLADFESKNNPEREAFYNNDYYDDSRMYRRRQLEDKLNDPAIPNQRDEQYRAKFVPASDARNNDNIIYVPDEKDPNVLRRAKIIKEGSRS